MAGNKLIFVLILFSHTNASILRVVYSPYVLYAVPLLHVKNINWCRIILVLEEDRRPIPLKKKKKNISILIYLH
jgi:hypothetical protein